MNSPVQASRPLRVFIATLLTVAMLRYAEDVFIPLALALLIAFVLAPIVDGLCGWRINRGVAVIVSVAVAVALMGTLLYVIFSQLADVVEKYVKKGDRIYVEGSIEYGQYQDKDGQTRYTTDIRVRELIMLGGGRGGDMEGGGEGRPARSAAPAKAKAGGGGDDFEDFPGALNDEDDDLPF